tara:strand:+ start:320 stop:493 length:174 start_codon:yes stop_codon:yes gene_type:complete
MVSMFLPSIAEERELGEVRSPWTQVYLGDEGDGGGVEDEGFEEEDEEEARSNRSRSD